MHTGLLSILTCSGLLIGFCNYYNLKRAEDFTLLRHFMVERFKKLIGLASIALAVAAQTGCSDGKPKRYPVRGIVRYSDGTLLTNGSIEFELMNSGVPVTATAPILDDGSFTLGTYAAADGAIAGNYRVAVFSRYEIGNGFERPGLIPPDLLAPRFRDANSSGLEFTVEPTENNFTVIVEYAPPDAEGTAASN